MNIFHVIAAANHDRPVFDDPEVVRDLFLGFEAVAEAGASLAAYCLMSAHGHLLIGVDEPRELAAVVSRLLAPTAWNLNRRYGQKGAIFNHSFWRRGVTSGSYLWTLPLYIHANPGPSCVDLHRLDVGSRSSQSAFMSGRFPTWLRPGVAFDQYAGGYASALADFLDDRASRPPHALGLTAPEECVVFAVSRVCGVRPATLCDPRRGGKRDRMLLSWALSRELGSVAAGRVLAVPRQTVRRWARIVAMDLAFGPLRSRLVANGG